LVRGGLVNGAGSDRAKVARVAAPVAFLLAVTIAVLLVRSGLRDDDVTPAPGPAAVAPLAPGPAVVMVRAGDTLERIAARTGTTVDALTRLNPGIDPEVLRVGQRVRVRS
jgi:LysM repeat protein